MYRVSVVYNLVACLGGMEMAVEFFKLHPIVEHAVASYADECLEIGHLAWDAAQLFFEDHCKPLIESDRKVAQAEHSRW